MDITQQVPRTTSSSITFDPPPLCEGISRGPHRVGMYFFVQKSYLGHLFDFGPRKIGTSTCKIITDNFC